MIDLSAYHAAKKRKEEIEEMIQALQIIPTALHKANIEMCMDHIEQLMPFINYLATKNKEGIAITDEELAIKERILQAIQQVNDYSLLVQTGIMKRLESKADKYYYHVKKLSEEGDTEARKIYEDLKIEKQKVLEQRNKDLRN